MGLSGTFGKKSILSHTVNNQYIFFNIVLSQNEAKQLCVGVHYHHLKCQLSSISPTWINWTTFGKKTDFEWKIQKIYQWGYEIIDQESWNFI